MHKKQGFTLVEMLFVVLIAAGILVFSVPAYKRVQERGKYNAALGTLLDINNAVTALKQDLKMSTGKSVTFPASTSTSKAIQFSGSTNADLFALNVTDWNKGLSDAYSTSETWNNYFMGALFKFGYLKPLTNTSNYSFYVIKGNATTVCNSKCRTSETGKNVVACMCNSTTGCYKGAIVLNDGSVQRIKGSACTTN